MSRPAVFLDRDDTLIANSELPLPHPGDLLDPALVRLLPGAREACEMLRAAGYLLVVITNQGGVARGHGTIADMEACNDRLRELVELDAVYCCPYHPKGVVPPYNTEHPWRKPSPGMILQAVADLRIDLSRSWLIGDAPRDVEAGRNAGIPGAQNVLIGARGVPDILAAARRVLG